MYDVGFCPELGTTKWLQCMITDKPHQALGEEGERAWSNKICPSFRVNKTYSYMILAFAPKICTTQWLHCIGALGYR